MDLQNSDRVMDLQGHADRVKADTENILGEAQNWMGHFIRADLQKNELISVSATFCSPVATAPPPSLAVFIPFYHANGTPTHRQHHLVSSWPLSLPRPFVQEVPSR